MRCPRCDIGCSVSVQTNDYEKHDTPTPVVRCQQCQQIVPHSQSLIKNRNRNNKVLWQLNEGDTDFCSPFTYHRALINVPGITQPVTMNRRINQHVIDFIRCHFIPRHSDVWLVTYPKSGTSE